MTRFEQTVWTCGDDSVELQQADDGGWVRLEDVERYRDQAIAHEVHEIQKHVRTAVRSVADLIELQHPATTPQETATMLRAMLGEAENND